MSLKSEMASLQDDLQSIPYELGFRDRVVKLRTITYTGANADAGTTGTATNTDTELSPRPQVDLKGVFRTVDGGVAKIGDAQVSKISRSYSLATLEAANEWLIDGERYSLIEGGIKVKDLEYVVTLKRMEG